MQQPIREVASPHGANAGELCYHHHHEDAGVESTKGAAPNNNESGLYDSQIPGHEHIMGVGMPPQQVYVNPGGQGLVVGHHHHHHHAGMASLQSQFQTLGFAQEEASSTEPSSSQSNANNADEDQDGEEDGEDEPIKLFVGQVPKTLSEEDIFPVFDAFGPLKDVTIIRDKHTGMHRGCAFVTYWNMTDAQTAQDSLHDTYSFPGARRPAQVKPAEPSLVPENKLFIGMLSRQTGEEEVRGMFEPFGEIQEIHMIRNPDGTSKCAAFLRFVSREAATSAIVGLDGQVTLEGSTRPLIVRFADSKQQRHQRQMRIVHRHDMMMPPPGIYPTYHPQMAPAMGIHPGAGAQNVYAMAPQHYAAAAGYPPNGQSVPTHAYMYPTHHHHHQYGHVAPYGYANHQPRANMRPQTATARPSEGPPGANLFVYHLPHDLTDADLATAFNPFGNVISAKVYVDKYTGESKGFGFVSYDTVSSADMAIEQMNGFQIGSKRLKVQHKRVHGESSPVMQAQPLPSHVS